MEADIGKPFILSNPLQEAILHIAKIVCANPVGIYGSQALKKTPLIHCAHSRRRLNYDNDFWWSQRQNEWG